GAADASRQPSIPPISESSVPRPRSTAVRAETLGFAESLLASASRRSTTPRRASPTAADPVERLALRRAHLLETPVDRLEQVDEADLHLVGPRPRGDDRLAALRGAKLANQVVAYRSERRSEQPP